MTSAGPALLRQGFPADFLDPTRIDYCRIRIRAADANSPDTAIQQYSVGAEKTFANAYVLSIDLVGSKGKNLANLVNLNQPIGGNGALPYPDFGFIKWREEKGASDYKGMGLGFDRRQRGPQRPAGPGGKGLDLSLQKAFDAGRARLSLGWDEFNVFDTVNLGLPDSNLSNTSTVGTIRSLVGDPRLMQFSVRLTF